MRIKIALAAIGLCLYGLLGPAQAAVDSQASAICMECHQDDDWQKMSRTAHAVTADNRTPTCVTCHGASDAHANHKRGQGKQPKPDRLFHAKTTLPATEASAVCQTCHDKDPKRALWAGSRHQTEDVACNACHKVHVERDKVLARPTQPEVCYNCHKEQRVQVTRQSRHPILEGKMACSDCHNVHGSVGPKLVKRDSTNDTCYTCHAEKRGPFVHPHDPVQQDCSHCHNPHGSNIVGMLVARPPMLCQQCHTPHVAGGVGALGGQPGVFPPAAPGQSTSAVTGTSSGKNVVNIWQARSCTNCHTQVHGSNNPSATNPTPQYQFR